MERETTISICLYFSCENFVGTCRVSHEQLTTIARQYLTKWEELTPSLGLTQQDEINICKTYKDYEDQKREALYTWKRKKGKEATYNAFIAAAEDISNMELADAVRELMKELQGMYACI